MNYSRSAIMLFLICLIPSASLIAQKKSEPPPLKIKANLMVLDSKNQFADVKPEDLTIIEDGVKQKVANLTKKDTLNLGIVIDNSGSLRFQFDAIMGTANLIVDNLRENDSAFAIRFISSDLIEVVQDWTSNKGLLKRGIGGMYIEGGISAVVDAIKLSSDKLLEKKDESKRSALILISDCEDRDSFYKFSDVLRTVKENGIEIYVIALMQDLDGSTNRLRSPKQKAIDFAKILTVGSGGMAYFPKWSKKKPDELIGSAKSIILELRSQYVVEYISTNSNPKDRERKLVIEAANAPDGEKRSAFTRSVIEIDQN